MREIGGGGKPAPTGPKVVRWSVVYPRPGEDLEVVCVSHAWIGMGVHWWKRPEDAKVRSHLCLAPEACVCLHEAVPEKWHAYIGVLLWRTARPAVLSTTPAGIDAILEAAGDIKTLRGVCLVLRRSSPHASSKVLAALNPKQWSYRLPEPFDVLPSLEAVYGVKEMATWKRLHNLTEATL